MKGKMIVLNVLCIFLLCIPGTKSTAADSPINVVTTFSDFAAIAREIGGDKVVADYLSQGDQDPHFVAP